MSTRTRHTQAARFARHHHDGPDHRAGHGPLLAVGLLTLGAMLVAGLVPGLPAVLPLGIVGLVAAVRAAREPILPIRLRQAWAAMAAAFVALVAAGPLVPAVTHVVVVVLLLVAFQRFPLLPAHRHTRSTTALDATIVLVGGVMLLGWAAAARLPNSPGPALLPALAALLPALVLLFAVALAVLRGVDGTAQRPVRLLGAGALILLLAGALPGGRLPALAGVAATALLAIAAVDQRRHPPPPVRHHDTGRYLPLGAVALIHGLLLSTTPPFLPWTGLVLGGTVLSGLLLARQDLVRRDHDEQALTDRLTGLADRSLFAAATTQALSHDARTGRPTAVLMIDLNGFRGVNDTLGQHAGDLVLTEFAEVLRRTVGGHGLPARTGGDEFAVLLPGLDQAAGAYEMAGRVAAALGPVLIAGTLVTLAAAIGVAVSAPGELDYDTAVQRAGNAMRRAKAAGTATRWAVWSPVEAPDQPLAA
ncbi:GGDEF domain-containing protein [Actinoplanes sp. NBRC 101535]|uniref:GGDEF domain-containing protein n=1 Tax=Actinoplanes sp. NBRC 101535 TaxID=3032196 RepID=UPI0024A1CA44|nr:GGDEF domain-containing protein [Actinoplanes sp. NBRC 101535]GLY02898.1 hypothetical protein Acsp01_32770 [Actinoplanes sp. NBRC 101535]